jgi:hypothetical protein
MIHETKENIDIRESINNIDEYTGNQSNPESLKKDNEIVESKGEVNNIKQKSCGGKASDFFRNFKDIFLMVVLLGANLLNFSILNIPFTLCGIIFIFLILNHTIKASKVKFIISIILLLYTSLVIIFKLLIVIFDYYNISPLNEIIADNEILLLDLGLRYLEDIHSFVETFNTFFGDILILFAIIVWLIIRYSTGRTKDSDNVDVDVDIRLNIDKTISGSEFKKFANLCLCFISLSILSITCVNFSLISIFYSLVIHLGLFLWSLKKDHASLKYQKFIYYIMSFLLIVNLLLTHIFNIYELRKIYMVGSSSIKVIRWLGIKKMKYTYDYFLNLILTVLANCLCIIAIKLLKRYSITNDNDDINDNKIKVNMKSFLEDKKDYNEGGEDIKPEVNKSSTWQKIKQVIVSYIFSPFFILHFCRLATIYWVYRYNNFPAIGLLIWLFYSFLIIKSESMKYITFIIAWPCLWYSYNTFMISNITDFIDIPAEGNDKIIWSQYCLENLNSPFLDFLIIQITIVIFSIFTRTNMKNRVTLSYMERKSKGDLGENLLFIQNGEYINENKIHEVHSEITFRELIVKLLITNIDKITVVVMYFLAIQKVNITHFSKIYIYI